MRKVPFIPLILGFMLLGMAASQAQSMKHCFNDSQFSGWWRAAGDKTLYIRTNNARYYRLDLAQSCGTSGYPAAHLIFLLHGSNTICSPLDFNLRVSQGLGDIARPCFVKSMSEVPSSEVATLKNIR